MKLFLHTPAEFAVEPGNLPGSQTAVFPEATGTVAVVQEHYDGAAAAVAGLNVGDLYFSLASNRFRIRTAWLQSASLIIGITVGVLTVISIIKNGFKR